MADERIKATARPGPTGTEITRAKRRGKTVPAEAEESSTAANAPRDTIREVLETVVFVVILVLLLKTFIAEAFVIPTGSMANTLYGHHEKVTCTECGFSFSVNTSKEVDEEQPDLVTGCTCPNCFHRMAPLPNRSP